MGSVQIKLLNDKLEEIHNLIDEGDEKLDEQNADAAEKKFKEANTLFGEIKPEIQRLREPEYLNQIIEIEETLDDRRAAVAEMRGMSPPGRSTYDGSSKRGVRFAGVPSSNEYSSDESGSGFSEESSDGGGGVSPREYDERTSTAIGTTGNYTYTATSSTTNDDTEVDETGYGPTTTNATSEYPTTLSDSKSLPGPSLGYERSQSFKGKGKGKSKGTSKGKGKDKSSSEESSSEESSSEESSSSDENYQYGVCDDSIAASSKQEVDPYGGGIDTTDAPSRYPSASGKQQVNQYGGGGDTADAPSRYPSAPGKKEGNQYGGVGDTADAPSRYPSAPGKKEVNQYGGDGDTADAPSRYPSAPGKKEVNQYGGVGDTADAPSRYPSAPGKKEVNQYGDGGDTADAPPRYPSASGKQEVNPYGGGGDTADAPSRYPSAPGKQEVNPYRGGGNTADAPPRYAPASGKQEVNPYRGGGDNADAPPRYAPASGKQEVNPYGGGGDNADVPPRYAPASGKQEVNPYGGGGNTADAPPRYASASSKQEVNPYGGGGDTADAPPRYASASGKQEVNPYGGGGETADARPRYASPSPAGENMYLTPPQARQGTRYGAKSDVSASAAYSLLTAPKAIQQDSAASFGDPVRTSGNRPRVPWEKYSQPESTHPEDALRTSVSSSINYVKSSVKSNVLSSYSERDQKHDANDQHAIGLGVSKSRRPMFTEDGQLLSSSDEAESVDEPLIAGPPRIPVKIGERVRRSLSYPRNRAAPTSALNAAFPYRPYEGVYQQIPTTGGLQPADGRARGQKSLEFGGDDGARHTQKKKERSRGGLDPRGQVSRADESWENRSQRRSSSGLYENVDESFLPAELPTRAATCLPKDSGGRKDETLQFYNDPMEHMYSKHDAFHAWITGKQLPQDGYVEVIGRPEKTSPPRRVGADDARKFPAQSPRGPQPASGRYNTPRLVQPDDGDQVSVSSEKPVPTDIPEPRTHFGPSPEKWPEESRTLTQPEPGRLWPAMEPSPPLERLRIQEVMASEAQEPREESPGQYGETFADSGETRPYAPFSLGRDAVVGASPRPAFPPLPGSDAVVYDQTLYPELPSDDRAPRSPPFPALPDSAETPYDPSLYPVRAAYDRAPRSPPFPALPDSAETPYDPSLYPERAAYDRAPRVPPFPTLPDSAETPYDPSLYPERAAYDRAPRSPPFPALPDSAETPSDPSLYPDRAAYDRAPRFPPFPTLPDSAETHYDPYLYPERVIDDEAAFLPSPAYSESGLLHPQPSAFPEYEQRRPPMYMPPDFDGTAQTQQASVTRGVSNYDLANSPQPRLRPEDPPLVPSQEQLRYFSSYPGASPFPPDPNAPLRAVRSTQQHTAHAEDMAVRLTDSMDPRNMLRRGPASSLAPPSQDENVVHESMQHAARPLPRTVPYSDHDRYAANHLIQRDGQFGQLIPGEVPPPGPLPFETGGMGSPRVRTVVSSPLSPREKRVSFHDGVFTGELGISTSGRFDDGGYAMPATSMGGGGDGGGYVAPSGRRKSLGVNNVGSYAGYDLLRPRNEDGMVTGRIAGGRSDAVSTSQARVASEAMQVATQHETRTSGQGVPHPSTQLSPRSTILRDHIDQTKVDQAAKNASPSDVHLPHPPAPAPLDDPVHRPVDWHARVQGLTANELALARALSNPPVSWGDVFGYATVRHQLRQHFVYKKRIHPLSERLKGVLLFGPPGCGKTLMVQALAAEIGPSCFAISAAKFKTVNEAAEVLRTLFSLARKILPSVIFVDDIGDVFDAHTRWHHRDADTIRSVFAEGVESIANDDVLMLCSTNVPFNLISSFTRMMPHKIYVPLPDQHVRRCVLEFYSRSWACLVEGTALDVTARLTAGYSSRDAISVVMHAISLADTRDRDGRVCYLGTQHFSEAMLMSPATISPQQILLFEDWAKRFAGTVYGNHRRAPAKLTHNSLLPNFAYRHNDRVAAPYGLRDARMQAV